MADGALVFTIEEGGPVSKLEVIARSLRSERKDIPVNVPDGLKLMTFGAGAE
jgi:hypothetical protein